MPTTGLAAAIGLAGALIVVSAHGQCVPTFATPPSFPAGNQPRTLVVANLNRDAYPDLVVGSWDYNQYPVAGLGILAGGPGGRLELTELLYDGHQVTDVVAGDFDADGDDDVAFHDGDHADSTVRMLRNDAGSFVESASFGMPGTEWFRGDLVTGDFNADGRADVVFLSASDAFLFLSRGDGSFEQKTFGMGLDVRPLAVDLDGDGRDELITGRPAEPGSTIEIFTGDPANGLTRIREIAAGPYPYRLAAGDFDGDGAVDLFALGYGTADLFYTVATATEATLGGDEVAGLAPVEVADLDRDGVDDLVLETGIPGHLATAFGRRDRTLVRATDVWWPGDGSFASHSMAVADFDLDGDFDVAAAESAGVVLLKNRGDGSLVSPHFERLASVVGDFNNDGRSDLLDESGVALAAPDGSIAPADDPSYIYDWASVADFNRDGRLDAIYYGLSGMAVCGPPRQRGRRPA